MTSITKYNKSLINKIFFYFILIFLFFSVSFIIVFSLSIYFSWKENWLFYVVFVIIIFVIFLALLVYLFFFILKGIFQTNKSLNTYIEQDISDSDIMGIVIYNEQGIIIWYSNFIKKRFGDKFFGKNINQVFNIQYKNDENTYPYTYKNTENDILEKYLISINSNNFTLLVKDVTYQESIITQYGMEQTVFGELEIDNFQLLQSKLKEDEIFKIQKSIVDILDNLNRKYNLSYTQYVNGKFKIITNKESLNKFIQKDFDFFTNINDEFVSEFTDKKTVSISVGFSYGTKLMPELDKLSKKALLYAQSRGGNQISVIDENNKISVYGSKTEIVPKISRTLIKNFSERIFKRLKTKDYDKIFIFGHKDMDLDALGSAYAIAKFFKQFNKTVYIQNSTFDNWSNKFLEEIIPAEDKKNLFIKSFQAEKLITKKSLAFIVDTSSFERTEFSKGITKFTKDNIYIIDHHRIKEEIDHLDIENKYIDTTASSTSEIVTEILSFTKQKKIIPKFIAQVLLNGIYVDTNKFQKSASTRTFVACSTLSEWGASIHKTIDFLKLSDYEFSIINKLLSNLIEVKKGYFLAVLDEEIPSDLISITADEIIKVKNRQAGFVVAKINKKTYKMSARSIDINIQTIAESLGGGGHFSAAAVTTENETLEQFTKNIKKAIVSVKNENNIIKNM